MQPDRTTRTCRDCSASKPLADFPRAYSNRDGIDTICRKCKELRVQRWKEANSERWRSIRTKANARYREKHKERARQSTVDYAERKRCGEPLKGREYKRYHNSLPEVKAAKAAWAEKNRDSIKRAARIQICKWHGITLEQYEDLLAKQNGVCGICFQPETRKTRPTQRVFNLAIDHDHQCCPGLYSCGKCVRGLLCKKCNQALGGFGDDLVLLQNAVDYISKR